MSRDRTIVFWRVSNAQPLAVVGDIADIVDGTKSIGVAIDFADGLFTQVRVIDLSEDLEEELLNKIKRVRVPAPEDPFTAALLSGKITIDESTLLNYVELV